MFNKIIITKYRGFIHGQKIIACSCCFSINFISVVFAIQNNTQDFDGNFTMDISIGKEYYDISYCLPNGRLGSAREYWDVNSDCEIAEDEIVVYFYDDSYVVGMESNVWEHAINTLTTSYLQIFSKGG